MFIRTESFRDFLYFYPVVSAIVAIQIAIWLIGFLIPPLGLVIDQFAIGQNYAISQGEYWRLVTPIFLHGGLGHILFNSFAIVLFAPALEQMLGKLKFLLVYFSAGIIANLFTFFVEGPGYSHVGASGAIFGMFGLYLFMVFFEKHLIDQQSAQIVLILTVISLVMTFIRPQINIAGHLFGFIGGFALGPLLLNNVQPFSPLRNRRRPRRSSDGIGFDPNRWNNKRYRIKRYIAPILIGAIIVFALIGFLASLIR
ncbi:S54 family peptidase [Gracilibacillus halophilus YIM-C55.5]|uniref:S54 family peptidase n=1 Tax=Gracilibacillus halophilus YIM-C55.5 TaxID=1308866 RepID=N4WT93_9BACI|nr:rhomboid family intramembrane serine protease [Gracilibacillus halophilus]ENH96386.1 S54 family peptidase [Gracilibacillus halophilus YIM-C55.5]